MSKVIVIDNPSNLPLIPLDEIVDFQGDLKTTSDTKTFRKLVDSIQKHHLFIAKAVFYEDGIVYTEDGHQTLKALRYLVSAGHEKCEVIYYALIDGRYVEDRREQYEKIMIPCQVIVPKGDDKEARLKDAAEKLLQINSKYADFNSKTSFFSDLGVSVDDIQSMLSSVRIPDLDMSKDAVEKAAFLAEFNGYNDDNCAIPLVPRFGEKYAIFTILARNETEIGYVKTVLEVRTEKSYIPTTPKGHKFGEGYVIEASRLAEIINKTKGVA